MTRASRARGTGSFLVGLTGPIGAGKSAVAKVWKALGAGVVEGDEMGRLALDTDAPLQRSLVDRFGSRIMRLDGSVDRAALAAMAFASAEAQRDLTRLTFPPLYALARRNISQLSRKRRVVVFDAALIFEWGVEDDFDLIVAVIAPPKLLAQRAAERLGVDLSVAEKRLALQLSPTEKAARADLVIMNDGNLVDLENRARATWSQIASKADRDAPKIKRPA